MTSLAGRVAPADRSSQETGSLTVASWKPWSRGTPWSNAEVNPYGQRARLALQQAGRYDTATQSVAPTAKRFSPTSHSTAVRGITT